MRNRNPNVTYNDTTKPAATPPAPPPAADTEPTPPADTPPPATPSPEDLQARQDSLIASMWPTRTTVQEPPPTDPDSSTQQGDDDTDSTGDTPPPADAPPPADDAANPPADATTTPPPPAASPPADDDVPPSTADIIAQTARATAQAFTDRQVQPPAAEPDGDGFEVRGADQSDYDAVAFLERSNPAKYSGLTDKYLGYLRKFYAYQDKWVTDNPGRSFNPDDEEHQDWFDKNDIGVTPEELDDAKVDLKVERKMNSRLEPELRKLREKEAMERAMPKMIKQVHESVGKVFELVDANLGVALKNEAGQYLPITAEVEARLEDLDPIAKSCTDIVLNGHVVPVVMELEKLNVPELAVAYDPAHNQTHATIERYRQKLEADMKKAPREVRIQNGREFLSAEEFARKMNSIERGPGTRAQKDEKLQEVRDTYWILQPDDIKRLVIADGAKHAKELFEATDKLAQKKYGSDKRGKKAADQPSTPPPTNPAPAASKPKPPTLSAQGDISTTPKTIAKTTKNFGDSAVNIAFP